MHPFNQGFRDYCEGKPLPDDAHPAYEHGWTEAEIATHAESSVADEITALRDRVAALEGALRTAQALVDCIEQGSGNVWWVNATDPENAVCHTDTVICAILATPTLAD